jgi:hypothetical protein
MKKSLATEPFRRGAQRGIRKNLIVVARSNVVASRGSKLEEIISPGAPVGRHLGRERQDCSGRPRNGVAIWCAPHQQNSYENITSTKLLDPNNSRIRAGHERLPCSRSKQSRAVSGRVQRRFGKHFASSDDVAAQHGISFW